MAVCFKIVMYITFGIIWRNLDLTNILDAMFPSIQLQHSQFSFYCMPKWSASRPCLSMFNVVERCFSTAFFCKIYAYKKDQLYNKHIVVHSLVKEVPQVKQPQSNILI